MSEDYSPAPGAVLDSLHDLVFLSQRDLGLQVPINFVTTPGISLSAACFANLRYEDDNAGDCLSDLIAVGFRRFEIDLFWDQGRQVWSFCPVAIPDSVPGAAPSQTATMPTGSNVNSNSASTVAAASSTPTAAQSSSSTGIIARQATSSPSSSGGASTAQITPTGTVGTTLGQSLPSISTPPSASNLPLVSIGPYVCTPTINLSTFISQFMDYIQKTENTIGAHLLYVTINIHAAADASSPLDPAPMPSALPQPENLLSSLFSDTLSLYLYTPSNLISERANINGSWYTVAENYRPIEDFYSTHVDEYGITSTEDGWPSEAYVEFSRSKRLLLGFGTVDPQMSGYDFNGDDDIIFPSGYIQNSQPDISANNSGSLTQGCFLKDNTDGLSQVNSSWATGSTIPGFPYPTTPSSDLTPLLNLTTNLTNCGISPILNTTLLNTTANDNFSPYHAYSLSTIWSWAPDEPKNQSSNSLFRCAFARTDLAGRWVVNDCSTKNFASCRAHHQPYNWTTTSYPITYPFAPLACPEGYDFAVPRTALENSYLFQAIGATNRDYDNFGVWVDFNSLDTETCWVSGGANATCPYTEMLDVQSAQYRRFVLVAVVAAIIVLIIASMTVFVKIAGHRKVRKRTRKRAGDGAVYEGVPS